MHTQETVILILKKKRVTKTIQEFKRKKAKEHGVYHTLDNSTKMVLDPGVLARAVNKL